MASVDEQARRLYLAGWLTRRAATAAGGAIPADASREALEAVAIELRQLVHEESPLAGLEFEPPYPGRVTEGAGATRVARLVLTCKASLGAAPLGVVFTVLIAGRRPEVSVAPPGAHEEHRPG